MIRMTEAQASLFATNVKRGGRQAGPRKESAPRVKRPAAELPENIVKQQILDFMKAHGWIEKRMHVGTYTPYRMLLMLEEALARGANMKAEIEKAKHQIIRIGKEGDADWRFEKPIPGDPRKAHLCCYVEMKGPGKRPKPEQVEWLARRNATGTPATWADGYDTGRSPFLSWYRKTFEPDMPLTNAERRVREDDDF